MKYNVGDLVKVLKTENKEVADRVSKVERIKPVSYEEDDVGVQTLIVRPKYFRETIIVSSFDVELVERAKPKTGKRGRPKSKPKKDVVKENTDLTQEQKQEVVNTFEESGSLSKEFQILWSLSHRIDKKINTNFGPVTLYQHLIAEIKRHTDTTQVKRG